MRSQGSSAQGSVVVHVASVVALLTIGWALIPWVGGKVILVYG